MNSTRSPLFSVPVLLLVAVYLLGAASVQPLRAAPQPARNDTEPKIDFTHLDGILIEHPHPTYPSAARKEGLVGTGLFQLNFDAAGKVASIALLRSTGHGILDRTCLTTFVHWRLRHPGEFKTMRIPMVFSIESR